ncbi:MAG: hypothetical protein J6P45_01720 [Lachnospiraceae bacterium]|nr:hypothetical protein [Lachnospiraceae bacterium]MBR1876267.1 hypothetical protein [Lachnospiraceae bacterium]
MRSKVLSKNELHNLLVFFCDGTEWDLSCIACCALSSRLVLSKKNPAYNVKGYL